MNKQNKKKVGFYILGSAVVAACAFIAMPKIIDFISTQMYNPKQTLKTEEDDWGPEIVKKEKTKEEKADGEL